MELKIGKYYNAKVTRILNKGVVVTLDNTNQTEFIHISKLSDKYISDISDEFNVGDNVYAIAVKGSDRIELSLKNSQTLNKGTVKKLSSQNKSLDEMILHAESVLNDKLKSRGNVPHHTKKSWSKNRKGIQYE